MNQENKKETISTLAALFYIVKNTISQLQSVDIELDNDQVDSVIFNNIIKHTDK